MYEPVAIVGTACRLPGAASTPSKLWDLLKSPRDVLKEFPPERLCMTGFFNENGDMRGRSNVRHVSYLLEEDIRHFDNAFFHINPKEAADMDPQQRILLETVYEAFESAGWSLDDVDGSQTSVHVGIMTDDYMIMQARDPDTLGGHTATGISRSILANRVSYAFNLQGASLALDTACSSSLVALHMAVQCLQRGEATRAVVAGTNMLMDSSWYVMGSSMHMISPESRCRMWDRDANGYARGEGCAAVVLKPLSQAIRDNDHIECVIRGTGVNSDGRADGSGITMPSPVAQAALIRSTYRAAGLDPVKDRCQYFECHGTGTQAGDPTEAQAIRDAFAGSDESPNKQVLYCGSIKTIIGHLEGCAGLAGVMKASLAIQNKAIPPNMHFNNLSPKVEPFYGGLQIPTSVVPWPDTGDGPRRASVNSFGFGGTNAHAILESYEPSCVQAESRSSVTKFTNGVHESTPVEANLIGPFVFSARSRGSLVDWLKRLLKYLQDNQSVDLSTLSNTLHSKRSVFRYRISIPTVADQQDLIEKLEDQINGISTANDSSLRYAPASATAKGVPILGVFTGQGAQAAQMGYAMLKHCEAFKASIEDCESELASIPDPPSWSLTKELAAETADSHVSEARFSQPLCTAIQIGLVDLLHSCGVRFSAVVGHSSGEIGAAYAAGLLGKRDAMGISYYRGCVSGLARGESGQPGSMMAASMSFDAAADLCSEPQFKGRINVAASNSPSSVTLSGDKDAVAEMKELLDGRQIQARALQVDTAYHSHHMRACAEPYLNHLRGLGVAVQTPPDEHRCSWYSSVRKDIDMLDSPLESGLEGQYWIDNLTQSVLFSEAVRFAVQGNPDGFTAAIEVGPHDALRGPVNQTLKQANPNISLPYTSCLSRGKNAIDTFSEALTTIWSLVPSLVQFAGWRTAFGLGDPEPPLKDLPPYAWDHGLTHWRESRVARNYRLNAQAPHDLLGRLWNNSGSEQTWRNTLRLSEMPWLKGHVFQNQILFPATGYISLAVDAAKVFVKDQPIKLIEVRNMAIPTALPVGEGDEVEVLFTIRSRVSPEKATGQVDSESVIEAEFTCCSYPDGQLEADKNCEGLLVISLGASELTDLAPTYISDVELTPFNVDRFYHAALEIGFGYQGPFRAMTSLNKCWGHAKAVAEWSREDPDMKVACTLHPAVMDIAFQTGLSTVLSAAEKSMHSPYLPVGVRRAVIDPNQNFNDSVAIEAYMVSPVVGLGPRIETDISIRSSSDGTDVCGIQLEGVAFKALSEAQPSEDRNILVKTAWGHDASYGLIGASELAEGIQIAPSSYTSEEYERVALFYLRGLAQSVSDQGLDALQPHHRKLVQSINAMAARVRQGSDRAFLRPEWLNDTAETIAELLQRDPDDVDMALLTSSEKRTQSILGWSPNRSNDSVDEREGHASAAYNQTTWGASCNRAIAQSVAQVSHTFPRTNILHLCGGAADTVYTVLDAVGDAYASYTCTDASQDTVDALRDEIGLDAAREKRLSFETFDDATKTGREPYDVIVVTDLCRVRPDVVESVRQLRRLLRPGGYLISTELTGTSLRPLAILGCSGDWWKNGGSGSGEVPGVKTGEWDNLLSNNGFSGIEGIFHDQPKLGMHGYSVSSAQALDERLDILRNPLTSLHMITPTPVVFIDGETSRVSRLIRQGKSLLRTWAPEVQIWSGFEDIDLSRLPPQCSVISLQDLDKPIWSSPPSVKALKNLKGVISTARNVLWVTSNRLVEDPYANIMVGIGRSLRHENIGLNLQFIDFDGAEPWDIQTIMTQFLRLIFSASSPDVTDGMLWVSEPEIVITNSQMITPRVVLDPTSNGLYNTRRRRVFKPVGAAEPIEVVHETSGASSESILTYSPPVVLPADRSPVHVRLSIALHVDGEAPRYLSCGRAKGSGGDESSVLTLSDTDASVVAVEKGYDYGSQNAQEYDATGLMKVACLLIASNVISKMPTNGTILVHGASEGVAKALSTLAAETRRNVLFVEVTDRLETNRTPGWIYLHPQSPARILRKSIPRDVKALFDLSGHGVAQILQYLPPNCETQVFNANSITQQSVRDGVERYQAHQDDLASVSMPTVLGLPDVSQKRTGRYGRLSVVTDWNRETQANAAIRGLDPYTLLSPNKTYFLVGMASELGQCLTYFLVRAGARHIVLSSRNPKDNQNWLRELRSTGIDIRIVKMDVTDRTQVHETVDMLRQTMPEIGGVTNAALVLEPAVFANLSAASIEKQYMPKICGTVYLDEVFRDDPLDFFMCFGSLGTVYGNPGHAMYHAGNAFMMSMVSNRRRRGLAGSILNFGMLVDVGYVARADRSAGSNVEEWLRADGVIGLSEADFHHVILQGIATGRPDSSSCEVIMGLETFLDKGQGQRPRWVGTAPLSHMIRQVSDTLDAEGPSSGSAQSQLESAGTVEEAVPTITELLSQKIYSMIHVSLDSIHPDEPFSRLGIDSINAIEIRKWLLERLRVEISMVKLLGRDPSSSILRSIATQYLAKRPKVQGSQPNGDVPVDKEEPQQAKPQVNGKLAETPPESVPSDHERSTTINDGQSSRDSKSSLGSAEITPGSSPVSTPSSKPRLDITRSERLSIAQAGLYYLYSFSDIQTALNITTSWRIDGPLDLEKLNRAFARTIDRHDSLRTCFFAASDGPDVRQSVTRGTNFDLVRQQSSPETADADVRKAYNEMRQHVYALETGDVMQARLIRHGPQWHTLVLGFHNMIIDVLSIGLILADIAREYRSQPWAQSPGASSYLDYTIQQTANVEAGTFDESIQYWINHLRPLPKVLPLLPVAKVQSRESRRSYNHHYGDRDLSPELVQIVEKISRDQGVTSMQFYLAAFQVFLARLLEIDDIIIGVLHNGRDPISEFWDTVGHLATILPMRFRGTRGKSFPEVMKSTRTTLLDGFEHANLPFALVVDRVKPESGEGNMPIIQVAFNYTVDEAVPKALGDCPLDLQDADFTTMYDFVLDVRSSGSGGHTLGITCTDDYYSLSATEFIAETFFGVLDRLIEKPQTRVQDCPLFTDLQLEQAKTVGHTPAIRHSWPGSLSERFDQVAARFPDSIAVKDGGETITYSQLQKKVELYAGVLHGANTTKGSRVAVFCKPSIDLYTAMLAIFRVGGVFVPLDVSVPATRRNIMMKSCGPHALIYHAATADDVAKHHTDINRDIKPLNMTQLAQAHQQSPPSLPERAATDPGADSHILFTSGSTGVPKGIRLHQRGIMNYAAASSRRRLNLTPLRVLQQTSLGFDASLMQIYDALTNAGTLVVAPFESRGDPDALSALILSERIQYTMCTPSEYSLLLTYATPVLRDCTSWLFAGAGGEVLPAHVVSSLRALRLPHLTLTNWYGPAEVSVVTGLTIPLHPSPPSLPPPIFGSHIGSPLPDSTIYILSESSPSPLPLPPGMPGEICVAGAMVANGYLDPALDARAFVPDPFASPPDLARGLGRMYRTGDRGMLGADGGVVFLGRTERGSTVVKLRGLRIDLEEVAGAVLRASAGEVAEAAVTVRKDEGKGEFLVAWVTFGPGKGMGRGEMVGLLGRLDLPGYMVPATVVGLERMPLGVNGKLDRGRLGEMGLPDGMGERGDGERGDGVTGLEERLWGLWVGVVGGAAAAVEMGGGTSFLAVGGNSFLLVHLRHAIRREFGVKIPLAKLWQAPKLRDMAGLIEEEGGE